MTMPGGGGNTRTAQVSVNADTSGYVKAIGSANAATLNFANTLKKIDDAVLSITKKLGVGAMAVGGAGLMSTFGDVKQAAALQQSFASLAAQATQTKTNVGQISAGVEQLSTQIPIATGNLAAMATQISSLGITGSKNILALTKQAEQLAAATNTAPGQLFTQLIQMNQSLGGSIQNLERYGSVLTTLQNNAGTGSTDVMSMANSIQAVGQKAGMSEQNILGFAAAMVKVGADGTAGATAFNSIMSAMTDSVSRNSTQMLQFTQVMGITVDQFKNLVTNDPTQAMVKFIQAIQSEGPRASITLQALGLDSTRLTRVFAALTSGQANLQGMLAQSNQAFSENSATAAAASKAWDTLNSSFVTLGNSVDQIKVQLGAPLLGPIQAVVDGFGHLTDAVSAFIHFTNDAPWPIGDTITSLVTKTPAVLLLGGAFVVLTASLSKFLGVWRMLTGAVGINAFRGMADGMRGNAPREIDGQTGRLGSMLYRSTYSMGRGNNDYGVNASRGIGSMVAGYPFMRARQQLDQAKDTLRHPLTPGMRDPAKTDPMSTYGMWQAASRQSGKVREDIVRRLREGDGAEGSTPGMRTQLAGQIERGLGNFDESAEGLRRRRFQYVETARAKATQDQWNINKTMSHRDLADTVQAGEAGRYAEKNGTLEGYQPSRFDNLSYRKLQQLGKKQAGWVGDTTATQAGKEFDASLSEKETAQLANPFEKLAAKVKEVSGKLISDTGDATKAIFAKITEWYGQAVNQIKALAAEAKTSMVELRAYMSDGTVRQVGMPGVAPSTQSLYGIKPPVPAPAGEKTIQVRHTVAGPAADLVNRLPFLPTVPGTRAEEEGLPRPQFVGTGGQTRMTPRGPAYDEVNLLGNRPPISPTIEPTRVDDTRPRLGALPPVQSTVPPVRVPGALRSVDELVNEQLIGYPSGTQFAGLGPRRGPLGMNQDAHPGNLEDGVGPGFERGGGAGATLRPRRLRTAASNWYQNNNLIGPESRLQTELMPKAGQALGNTAKGLGESFGALKTTLMGVLSPQVMIAATLLGPALYGLVQKVQESKSLAASTGDFAGQSTAVTLGQQVQTPAQIAASFSQKSADSNTANFFNDTAFANAKSGSFQDNNAEVISSLKAIGNSKMKDDQKLAAERLVLQREAAGDVMSNSGNPLSAQQQAVLAQQAMAFTGDQALAQNILGGPTESAISVTGQGATGYYTNMPGIISAANGDDKKSLVKGYGAQALSDYTTNKGAGLVGLFAGAGQSEVDNNTNTWSSDRASNVDKWGGPGMPTPKQGSGEGFGGGDTTSMIKSFVDSWNAQDNNKTDARKLDPGDEGETSVQGFAQYIEHASTAKGPDGKFIAGHDAAVEMANNLKLAGVNIADLAKGAPLTTEALAALKNKAMDAANAIKPGGSGQMTGTDGKTLAIQAAYQGAKGDNTGTANFLDLLNTPDAANYSRDVDKTLSNLYQSSGGNSGQTFDPANADAFRKEAEAIEQLKQTVQSGGPQWQQLDQLEKTLYGQSATAAVGIGGGIKEQVQATTTNLQDLLDQQTKAANSGDPNDPNHATDVLNALAPEIDTQKQALEQSTNQLFQQLDNYYYQVQDFNRQQERQKEDHNLQMTRMDDQYKRQVTESDYQFYQVQQPEAAYQFQKSQEEQLYQFQEQLRLRKYAISQTWGSPTSMVQAQFTQGSGSALQGLQRQTNDLQKSQAAMDQMSQMGVSTDVIRTLGLDDPKNFEQAQRYLTDFISNPKLVQSFNDAVAKNLNVSAAIGSDPNNSQYAEMQKQFDHTGQLAAESFAHSAKTALDSFTHAAEQSKQSYDIQMSQFQQDYETATSRSLDDLSRLGQDTQKTWQDLVTWANQSGIPGVMGLGTAGAQAIGLIQAAASAVSGSLASLPGQMNTAITQIDASLQGYLNSNPALRSAFEAANGIDNGGAGAGSGQTDKGANQQLVQGRAQLFGWGSGAQWDALQKLITRESGFNNTAQNPTSTAYGMFQFLNDTWAGVGGVKTSDPTIQTSLGLKYILGRYGNPVNAWAHEQSAGWYASGAIFNAATPAIIGEAGPEMVLPLDARGAGFMARTTGAVLQKMGIDPSDVRRNRVAQGMPMQAQSNMSYHHTDASTNFNGAITVIAQDPNEMAAKLAAKRRLTALTNPVARR